MMNTVYNLIKTSLTRSRGILVHGNSYSTANTTRKLVVLGIETSCDDTGAAIVAHNGKSGEVLAESLYSQQNFHLKYGGIIPPRAQDLHRENIEKAVSDCITAADFDISKIDAIAVTNRPGLPMSLQIGVRYGKYLARKHSKPLIPIHHMEAHALAARLESDVSFPYLCLLISGGHSQLVIVNSPEEFCLLGETMDDAPGEAFDKIARRLRLNLIPRFENMNGGRAIETAALECTDSDRFEFPLPLARNKDCNFSFAGLKNVAIRHIKKVEEETALAPDDVIPHYKDFSAGFLKAITRHLSHRTQRAIEFCDRRKLLNECSRSLVISGGVALNDYIFESLSDMATHYCIKTVRPPKKYCSDNGVMIAWNGIEKILHDERLLSEPTNLDEIEVIGKSKLGVSLVDDVVSEDISCKWIKVKKL